MTHPYRGLPEFRFWSSAMAAMAPGHIDPMLESWHIEPHHRVATMGSCFSQRLAQNIRALGPYHLDVEQPPADMTAQQAADRHYGVFSARYGNVYSARQALQLFDRAFGEFQPVDTAWALGDRFVDPFRPQLEPGGYVSAEAVAEARREHLACVRQVFLQADWLVLTLGLTEAWVARGDGAVFPLAPGVAGGHFDPDRYAFVNFSAAEVAADLDRLVRNIQRVRPSMRIVLSVSPVPMAATWENRHVLVSNTLSKSALRVAVDETERRHPQVRYFPGYEIVISPAAGGRYYADDLRQVTPEGVRHVMRVFSRHYLSDDSQPVPESPKLSPQTLPAQGPLCDEDAIEESLRRSGLR